VYLSASIPTTLNEKTICKLDLASTCQIMVSVRNGVVPNRLHSKPEGDGRDMLVQRVGTVQAMFGWASRGDNPVPSLWESLDVRTIAYAPVPFLHSRWAAHLRSLHRITPSFKDQRTHV